MLLWNFYASYIAVFLSTFTMSRSILKVYVKMYKLTAKVLFEDMKVFFISSLPKSFLKLPVLIMVSFLSKALPLRQFLSILQLLQ